ncbi:MAG: hypothetical protein IT332_09690 [Ardenticatenales bacterium]|nr:hypothetical protein [Ardenticatenales bacterium]
MPNAPHRTPAPAPAAHRTVRGAFRATSDLDRALARLASARPPAVVAVFAADATAERWLAGSSSGAARTLLVVPHGARAEEAAAWLGDKVRGRGGRMAVVAAAAITS